MTPLSELPVEDSPRLVALRAVDDPIALARALGQHGCGYEAALILRPLRKRWRDAPWAEEAQQWLAAQTHWNKQGRQAAALRVQGDLFAAESLVSLHEGAYWDFPPALMLLAQIAQSDGRLERAKHLYQRLVYLAQRGVPKINMVAYGYLPAANLIDIQAEEGDPAGALAALRTLDVHTGNRHHYDMLLAELLAMTGDIDAACKLLTKIVRDAKRRKGSTGSGRLKWAASEPRLAPLRGTCL